MLPVLAYSGYRVAALGLDPAAGRDDVVSIEFCLPAIQGIIYA
jgi:hypothetical protein